MSSIGTKKLTFDEWQALPETKQRCEVVDGVLVMPPSPLDDHQWIIGEIFALLREFVVRTGSGLVLMAPRDVLIRREPLRVRQPDILFLSAERTGVVGRPGPGRRIPLEIAPDLVVEVLSPNNTRREMEEKLADYSSIGVLESWLVSPQAETIEVLLLTAEASTIVATFGIGDTLRSDVLPGFTLPIADIFGPLLR
jgi:Uma2 family endonuclease